MVIAQATGEYGAALAQAFSAVTAAFSSLEQEARQIEPTTWIFVGIAVVGVWLFLRR